MTPLDYYKKQVQAGQLREDSQQILALERLEKTYQDLIQEQKKRSGIFSAWRRPRLLQGHYLWGGVGIGKTFLMDCFYHCLPFAQKRRFHFHQFMRFIHQELKKHQGTEDPLQVIAGEIAEKNLVLCFDELVVADISDAMILGRLFKSLFSKGVCLIATSNLRPDDLYKNGLQRQHFLPVIELLKKELHISYLSSVQDYRLRHLKDAGVFYIPNDGAAQAKMEKSFMFLANDKPLSYEALEICDRKIPIVKEAGEIVWFDFNALCTVPRSQQDYLAIAEKYRTVFISNIPLIVPEAKAKINLFIRLIDVFYDARLRLVLSAEVPVDKIYCQGQLVFDYARTCSRLLEMQSETYFLTTV